MIIQTQKGSRVSGENSCNVISQFIVRTLQAGSSSTYYTALHVAKPPILESQLINTEYTIGTIPFVNGYTVTQITVQQGGTYTTKYKQGSIDTLDTPILINDHTTISYYLKPGTLYLFDASQGGGKPFEDITGGWTNTFSNTGAWSDFHQKIGSYSSSKLSTGSPSYGSSSIGTKKKIDFTGYTTLHVEWSDIDWYAVAGYGGCCCGVSSTTEWMQNSVDLANFNGINYETDNSDSGTAAHESGTISLSAIKGGLTEGYLWFGVNYQNTDYGYHPRQDITKIWLT